MVYSVFANIIFCIIIYDSMKIIVLYEIRFCYNFFR